MLENQSTEGSNLRAAMYVRMSTDHQKYSTENQADAIRDYAAHRKMQIVKTYTDAGKSGLKLDGRDALQSLIADVQSGTAGFNVILVLDVTRWGRFQDADESAYYEYICRRAGIDVQYVAEQFENDGSPVSTIVKGVKRAMAGEYSRELSCKVFAGQCRLIELGFRQGGPAGYGLRRVLVDEHRNPKGQLTRGEQKSLQTDRVILVPGPEGEVENVRWIYRAFTEEDMQEGEIAAHLNQRGVLTDLGRPWTRGTVHEILINEKYIGHNVFNRKSFKLKKRRVTVWCQTVKYPDSRLAGLGVSPEKNSRNGWQNKIARQAKARGAKTMTNNRQPPKTYTPYQGQYFAHALTLDGQAEETISRSIASAKVDMNPHQVEAALFALRSPLLQGVILADEVGLGKTIEAILELMIAMGYGGAWQDAAQQVGRTGDGGIDGIINEDVLGLDVIYLQAKRYQPDTTIPVEAIRGFSGALTGRGATKGVFVCTCKFSQAARDFAANNKLQKIILIDGDGLTKLMIKNHVGLRVDRSIEIKKIDMDFFEEYDLS